MFFFSGKHEFNARYVAVVAKIKSPFFSSGSLFLGQRSFPECIDTDIIMSMLEFSVQPFDGRHTGCFKVWIRHFRYRFLDRRTNDP